MYGWSEAEALTMNIRELSPLPLRGKIREKFTELSRASVLSIYQTQRLTKDGDVVEVRLIAMPLYGKSEEISAIVTTERAKAPPHHV